MFKTLKEKLKIVGIGFKKSFAGQIMLLASAAIGLGLTALIITFTAKVNTDVSNTLTAGSAAKDAALNGTQGLGNLASNLGTVGSVAAIAVIILLLLAAFGGFLTGKQSRM